MEAFVIIFIIVAVLGAFGHHGRRYRQRRRAGWGVWLSLPMPFGLRDTVSRRFGGR
jgi:hypothetical protein